MTFKGSGPGTHHGLLEPHGQKWRCIVCGEILEPSAQERPPSQPTATAIMHKDCPGATLLHAITNLFMWVMPTDTLRDSKERDWREPHNSIEGNVVEVIRAFVAMRGESSLEAIERFLNTPVADPSELPNGQCPAILPRDPTFQWNDGYLNCALKKGHTEPHRTCYVGDAAQAGDPEWTLDPEVIKKIESAPSPYVDVSKMGAKRRCPFFSRGYNVQCEQMAGHDGLCSNGGDGFAGGWDPTLQPDPLKPVRCPSHSEERGVQCDLNIGHTGMCTNKAGFAWGQEATKNPRADLPKGQRRVQLGRRKKATRRR